MATQVATTGNARVSAIPATTVSDGGTFSCTIFSGIDKSSDATVNEQMGNDGELTGLHKVRDRFSLSFSCIPIAATKALAQEIIEAMPKKLTELTITCTDDTQVAGVCYVDSATARYTPDGDAVVDITATKYLSAAGATLDFATVS